MKLKNMLARVIVNLVNESEYSFTALSGENLTSVEHLQEFGFASKKPDGEEANGIALFYGGDRGNSSLLVLEVPKFKPDLEAGETALFSAFGSILKMLLNGDIELTGTGDVRLIGDVIELNGNINEGLIKIQELTDKLNGHIDEYDIHKHTYVQYGTGSLLCTIPTSVTINVPTPGTQFDKNDYENDKVVH